MARTDQIVRDLERLGAKVEVTLERLLVAARLPSNEPAILESVPCSQFVDTPSEIGANREKLGVVPQTMERADPPPRHSIDHGKVEKSIFDRQESIFDMYNSFFILHGNTHNAMPNDQRAQTSVHVEVP